MICITCTKETTNNKFCSRSCAAKHNNTKFPKRKTKKLCSICASPTGDHRRTRCPMHQKEYLNGKIKNKTIAQYVESASVRGKHPSWKFAAIRGIARNEHKDILKLPCAHCGYDKHVELCHIKAISTFPESTTLGEVNSKENVIQLCPNCHWEFDNLPRF